MILKTILKALLGLLLFILLIGIIGYWLDHEMQSVADWVFNHFSFTGLCFLFLFTDTLVTPISPDVFLIVLANSQFAQEWILLTFILGLVSVSSGMLGWCIGRWLKKVKIIQRLYGQITQDSLDFLHQYGFWGIVLGAITPMPYSLTCWTAGAIGLDWKKVLAASILFRIPRIMLAFMVIIFINQQIS